MPSESHPHQHYIPFIVKVPLHVKVEKMCDEENKFEGKESAPSFPTSSL